MDLLVKNLEIDQRIIDLFGLDLLMSTAASYVKVPAGDNSPWIQARLTEIRETIQAFEAQSVVASRFPVFNAQKAVTQPIWELKQMEMHFTMALMGYPALMDPTFLSWHQPYIDWPSFMILSLDNPVTTLKTVGNHTKYTRLHDPVIPDFLMAQFDRAYQYLAFNFSSFGSHESFISCEFVGLPGPATIQRIENALIAKNQNGESLFDEVLLIAEAGEWKRGGVALSFLDPFVVGLVKKTQQLFMIDIFNPSLLELTLLNSHFKRLI